MSDTDDRERVNADARMPGLAGADQISDERAQSLVELHELPQWYQPLAQGVIGASTEQLVRFSPPAGVAVRESSVLILMSDGADQGTGPDVVLIRRATNMSSHSGQPAFPGGKTEPEDASVIATALREGVEEIGVDPSGIAPTVILPRIWVPPSGFAVTPVMAWWRQVSPIEAHDPREVAGVHRVTIEDLVNPRNRVQVTHPSGYVGPGFDVAGMLVWGFTGMLLDRLLTLADWSVPWESNARTIPYDQLIKNP